MRYTAPPHTSDVTLSIGVIAVVKGQIEVPDDLSVGDVAGLIANGFEPVVAEAAAPAAPTKPPATKDA